MLRPVPIRSQPGVKRDGTRFDGDAYIEALWCRFQRGKPRKIAGYRAITSTLLEKIYGMNVLTANGFQYIAMGSESSLQQVVVNATGVLSSQNDRTPAGLTASADNLWQFDVMRDQTNTRRALIGHAAPNLAHIDSTVERPIYIGDATANTVLTASAMDPVSGGVVCLYPYLLGFGNDGRVDVSAVNAPAGVTAGSAFITGSKIVKGMPFRGNGSGPAGLLWSLDSLQRATFTTSASTVPFGFDPMSNQTSILSSQSVIEYDGEFIWLGVDRFFLFNGVVQEIQNDMNMNFFFDNINMAYRQKAFVTKVTRFGEIWFCAPLFGATECNWAIIWNRRENIWYDTPLPGGGRSAGYFAQVYAKPFMVDLDLTATGYTLWQHETGMDKVIGTLVEPIRSNFVTSELALSAAQEASLDALRCARLEPDFVQVGNLTVQVQGRANARSAIIEGEMFTFPDVATGAATETVPMKDTQRLMAFKFESNSPGGNYQMGKTLGHIEKSDGRVTR